MVILGKIFIAILNYTCYNLFNGDKYLTPPMLAVRNPLKFLTLIEAVNTLRFKD